MALLLNNNSEKRFSAHDELGVASSSLVSPEQPVVQLNMQCGIALVGVMTL